MRPAILTISALFLMQTLGADTLGFIEQKFGDIHFEAQKWSRVDKLPCFIYTPKVEGAVVEILRVGSGSFVPFRAAKNSNVTVCGSVAAFDEGFQTGSPVQTRLEPK